MATTTKYSYTRTCKCGDVAIVSYKPKGTERCKTCAKTEDAKQTAITRYKGHKYIKYIYLCPYCPEVVERVARKKTALCGMCSRKYAKSMHKRPKYVWSYDTMRYFRICEDCPPDKQAKQVSSPTKAGLGKCPKHSKPPKQPKVKAKAKAKAKKASPEAIAKVREVNRQHRLAEERKIVALPTPSKSNTDMMAEWLADNKVTVIVPTYKE